ncbi:MULTISPECIES: carbohydrate ABC transporter permease [Brevibacillus]|jgi:sn-glycerol 3-phosphate transport system permease protein|uniref:Carbohydrate ABC transporter permease n=1 Tax=Brevibacillus nitrificans TaxID=651560 RepID=A0A3M8CUF8_9BACL|nr:MULTISPECIES: carbohydrate ABC transporter permease [Brevibacillus]MDR7315178.1 sn-glycerol 3-phosphate transport system permease protein [Brevibacillus nitrificans]MEC2127405.1 carbohydrate ABC transporter permease [Brevibacillus centrosporus]MED1791279.1 carbohydrate ABC transporter permease [Brevibacillus nitrificans]MED1952178.1 carbohydrate ABC transporter permease [Brevibacillus centrosporus]RNB67965.1 carbohydrate ABC transporter permease [Brevibacillus centrosporus]
MLQVGRTAWKTVEWVLLAAVGLVFVFPFLWMFLTAFKTMPEVYQFPPTWWPESWQFENFRIAWSSGPFVTYVMNSILVAGGILILQFLIAVPAAYAFARYRFPGRNLLFGLSLIALMIPSQVIFLPVYVEMSHWGLVNTLWSLILPFGASAFGIFLLRQAFMQVPDEVIEAARLDSASEWKIMWTIMVPMAKPVLVTFGLFSFIYHWNDYFWPLIMTNSDSVRTLPIGISMLKAAEGGKQWNVIMAGNMILVLPILVVFFFAQRHIISAFVYQSK